MTPDDPDSPQPRSDREELLNFSELDWFTANWEELGLTDEDLLSLQITLMENPKRGPVVRGTGGLRKFRFSPPAWKRGKSGALRVCYLYFEKYGFIVLVTVYAKSDMDNLSDAGKNAIKSAIGRIEIALRRRFGF